MQANDWLTILFGAGVAVTGAALARGFAMYFEEVTGIFEDIFNGIKSGLYWILMPPQRKPRRTPLQIEYNTDMTWAQVRWSIARLEHEMLPPSDHTHDAVDCVHPDCNPRFLRKMTTLAWESVSHESFTCPECFKTSYNPNDVREQYCGNCHKFWRDTPRTSNHEDLPF
jgi:hypothetical protein